MERREFLASGVAGALTPLADIDRVDPVGTRARNDVRALFPRLAQDTFISAAAGTPLGTFAEAGVRRYLDLVRLGPGGDRRAYFGEMMSNVRTLYADLIGARPTQIALVHSTKAGEQIVTNALDVIRSGKNIVTNDMHFAGALHNLLGLQRAGADVRIVRNEGWDVSLDDMEAAIDDRTALVSLTLVSNVTGRIEPMRQIADIAHAHGALVYADIIQAAGILPFDVNDMGIDVAAANGYKWLYGLHGSGFLYVREDLQGTAVPDELFPGHVQYNYPPWSDTPDPSAGPYSFSPRSDASRYEPGHVSYLGYCGLYEGLKFLHRVGVQAALDHSVRLNRRLEAGLDSDRFDCISIHQDRSPIITFAASNIAKLRERLQAANVVVSMAGGNRVRISPAVYNTDEDIDRLIEVMNAEDI